MLFDTAGWYARAVNYTTGEWRSPNFGFPNRGDAGNKGRRFVCLHVTDGTDSRDWLCSPASKVSAHFLLRDEGIYQLVSIFNSAWSNGIWDPGHTYHGVPDSENPNEYGIGIEREGRPRIPLSAAIEAETITLLRDLASVYPQFSPYLAHRTLIGHYEISPTHRPNCPGPLVDFARIAMLANAAQPPPTPPVSAYTADAPLIGVGRATAEQATAYVLSRPHPNYEDGDIAGTESYIGIVPAYWQTCVAVGIDPVLAVAQMIHETENLTSFWSARGPATQKNKRRNPAGIGVTGDHQRFKPDNADDWAYNPSKRWWEAGCGFASWKDDSIPAHVGRLLAYALPAGEGTPAQRALIAKALSYRPLAVACQGSAPTLKALGKVNNSQGRKGCGWASPGDQYGAKIAAVANAICGVQV